MSAVYADVLLNQQIDRQGNLVVASFEPSDGVGRRGVTSQAPITEFRHVHAAIPGFATINPGLGMAENGSDLTLC